MLICLLRFLYVLCTLPKTVNSICINKETVKITVKVLENEDHCLDLKFM